MLFIDACFKRQTKHTPVWIMRQAGRYMPEYRALRAKAGSFLELCKNVKLASDVTMQPIDYLDVDAAILFSDILTLPASMGMNLSFVANKGPVFSDPLQNEKDLLNLKENAYLDMGYVYDIVSNVRARLDKSKALIGFAGSPWTVATYLVEGSGSKTFYNIKEKLYTKPNFIHQLLKILTEETKLYLENQIKAGADAIMLFDSWANALAYEDYYEFSFKYMLEISDYLKEKYPHIAIILFPRGVSSFLPQISGNFDVVGIDWSTSLKEARDILSDKYTLQGNMEPSKIHSKKHIDDSIDEIVSIMKGKNHIFNFGHGIMPSAKPEMVKYFIEQVHEKSRISKNH